MASSSTIIKETCRKRLYLENTQMTRKNDNANTQQKHRRKLTMLTSKIITKDIKNKTK